MLGGTSLLACVTARAPCRCTPAVTRRHPVHTTRAATPVAGALAQPVLERRCTSTNRQALQLRSRLQLAQQPPRRQRRQRLQQRRPCALFTGIVQGKATVRSVRRQGEFASLSISFPAGAAEGVQIGGSVAINGTCLTVTSINEGKDGMGRTLLGFDVISETLRATNLSGLQMNSTVNFERSARMGDEIGGHHVSGHVHTTAALREVMSTDVNNRKLTFEVPEHWTKYLLPKGFVAVDGCSLTVGEVAPDSFSVYLIPETLRTTILGDRKVGDAVNIEIDSQTQAIVDTVEALLPRYMVEAAPQRQGVLPRLAEALSGGGSNSH